MTAEIDIAQPNVYFADGDNGVFCLTGTEAPSTQVSPRTKALAIALAELALQRAKVLDDGSLDD